MTKLKFLGFDELEKAFQEDFKSGKVEFGYGEKSGTHPSGKITYADIAYISEWGAHINVFGNDGFIPKRPFFSDVVDNFHINTREIEHGMLVKGVFRTAWVIDTICENLQLKIKYSILDWETPPNARLTIRKKGFDNPLVETGGLAEAAKKQGDIQFF